MLRVHWDHVSTYISGNVQEVDVIIKLFPKEGIITRLHQKKKGFQILHETQF